jgi:hypothetical protein
MFQRLRYWLQLVMRQVVYRMHRPIQKPRSVSLSIWFQGMWRGILIGSLHSHLPPSVGATISNVAASSGTISGAGPYTVTGITSATGVGSVTITLDVTGDATIVQTVAFAITSAKELQYQTTESNATNNSATQTINAIPATTGFSAN